MKTIFSLRDTSARTQIFVNRAAKLDRLEAFLIRQMLATSACPILRVSRLYPIMRNGRIISWFCCRFSASNLG